MNLYIISNLLDFKLFTFIKKKKYILLFSCRIHKYGFYNMLKFVFSFFHKVFVIFLCGYFFMLMSSQSLSVTHRMGTFINYRSLCVKFKLILFTKFQVIYFFNQGIS